MLFVQLPCAGCHGATAQGQFGPPLAGTTLSLEEVRRQVRTPQDKMQAFDEEVVSDEDVRDIYAWLVSLPAPAPTAAAASPAEATAQARDRLFPELDATALVTFVDELDELNLRLSGQITAVEIGERFTNVRLRVNDGDTTIEAVGIYDTLLARQPFPAAPGDQVTLYGVGALPETVQNDDESLQHLPKLQILYVDRQ
jgi:hypothetical protein